MTKGFYNLTSGMLSQSRRLDTVGNNMVNITTPGYKQEIYTDTTFDEVLISRIGNKDKRDPAPLGQESYILAPSQLYVDHQQGAPEETGQVLDFAIQGEGFFAIQGANGVEYTRNGRFVLDEEGYLCLPKHGRVLGTDGRPLRVMSDNIRADNYGRIEYGDGSGTVGQLGVFVFPDAAQLAKGESGLFTAGGQQAALSNQPVLWKYIESSNVDMIQEMSRMMTAQRALQSAAQVLGIYDGILVKASTEVGRM